MYDEMIRAKFWRAHTIRRAREREEALSPARTRLIELLVKGGFDREAAERMTSQKPPQPAGAKELPDYDPRQVCGTPGLDDGAF